MTEKLNGSGDDNRETLYIEEREGAIIVSLGETYAILPPQQAIDVGEVMVRYGHHALTGQEKPGPKVLSEKIREKIENRVMLVIANLQERKKQPLHVAQEVVDIVLREAL